MAALLKNEPGGRQPRPALAAHRSPPLPPCDPARAGSGILVCILTTLIATDFKPARVISEIESTLKMQLVFSTLLMTPVRFKGGSGGRGEGWQ